MTRLAIRLLSLIWILSAIAAAGQSFDLEHDKYADNVRIMTASDILTPDLIDFLNKMKSPLPEPVAVGIINGVTFIYRKGGVGLFAIAPNQDWKKLGIGSAWMIECSKDPIDDSISCWLRRDDLALRLADGVYQRLVIGKDHYPNSFIALRVDQNPPFRDTAPSLLSDQAEQAVAQMLSGQTVVTRYQEWPYQSNVDRTMNLYGFKEALEFLRWAAVHFK